MTSTTTTISTPPTPSARSWAAARWSLCANGNTSTGGPVGKGNLLIAKSAYTGSTTPALTSNSTSGYTISNPVYFSGTNDDVPGSHGRQRDPR